MPRHLTLLYLFFLSITCFPLEALDLKELVSLAMSTNLSIKRARLQVESFEIDKRQAYNEVKPKVDGNIVESRKTFLDSTQKSVPFLFDTAAVYSLNITQSLPGLGKIPRVKQEIARLRILAKEIETRKAESMVCQSVVTAFFGMLKESLIMKIHQENLALLAQLMEVARLNMQLGLALPNDILRIEVQQRRTEQWLTKSKNAYENYLVDLEALMNRVGSGSLEVTLPATPTFRIASLTPEAARETMMARDLDLDLMRNDASILRKGIDGARHAKLPTLSLSGNYSYGRKVGPMRDTNDYTVGMGLAFPVFDNGKLADEVHKAEKSLQQIDLGLEELVNAKKALLAKDFSDYREVLARMVSADKAMEQARENMRMVMTRYQYGSANIIELVDAQLTLSSSAQEAAEAHVDERLRLADILFALNDLDGMKQLDQGVIP